MKFPSTQWFEALQHEAAQKPEQFKKLGFMDANVGIMVTPSNGGSPAGFILEFKGYGCKRVTEEENPAELADFVLTGASDAWQEMIENIREHGEPDLGHTLNVLTLPGVPFKIEAEDGFRVGGAQVEPPIRVADQQAVEVRDLGRVRVRGFDFRDDRLHVVDSAVDFAAGRIASKRCHEFSQRAFFLGQQIEHGHESGNAVVCH